MSEDRREKAFRVLDGLLADWGEVSLYRSERAGAWPHNDRPGCRTNGPRSMPEKESSYVMVESCLAMGWTTPAVRALLEWTERQRVLGRVVTVEDAVRHVWGPLRQREVFAIAQIWSRALREWRGKAARELGLL